MIGFIACAIVGVINYYIKKDVYFGLFSFFVPAIVPLIFLIYYFSNASKSIEDLYNEISTSSNFMTNIPAVNVFVPPVILEKALTNKDEHIKKLTIILLIIGAIFVTLLYILPNLITDSNLVNNIEIFGGLGVILLVILVAILYKRS